MKYKVFRDLVLVKKVKEEKREVVTGFILPDSKKDRFIKLEILEVGPDVKEDIKPGDIVYAEKAFEAADFLEADVALMLSHYIVMKEEK